MKSVVRAFLFNSEGKILLVQHKANIPWSLPGGHVENNETIHAAMIRELREELSLEAQFFEIDHEENLHHKGKKLNHHPLPLSIYDLEYKNTDGIDKSRTEYIFLMETDGNIGKIQDKEIHAYQWFEVDDVLMMKPNIETWDFIIEMLDKITAEDGEE